MADIKFAVCLLATRLRLPRNCSMHLAEILHRNEDLFLTLRLTF